MTMVGLTMAGRHCHPTNPPPTRYKPPKMKSISQIGNSPINKSNKQITRPMGHHSTIAYVAVIRPPLKLDETSTMTHPAPQKYKLPIISKLQKPSKMKIMKSKYDTKTTITLPNASICPTQSMTNPPITANTHDRLPPIDRTSNPAYPANIPSSACRTHTLPPTDHFSLSNPQVSHPISPSPKTTHTTAPDPATPPPTILFPTADDLHQCFAKPQDYWKT